MFQFHRSIYEHWIGTLFYAFFISCIGCIGRLHFLQLGFHHLRSSNSWHSTRQGSDDSRVPLCIRGFIVALKPRMLSIDCSKGVSLSREPPCAGQSCVRRGPARPPWPTGTGWGRPAQRRFRAKWCRASPAPWARRPVARRRPVWCVGDERPVWWGESAVLGR